MTDEASTGTAKPDATKPVGYAAIAASLAWCFGFYLWYPQTWSKIAGPICWPGGMIGWLAIVPLLVGIAGVVLGIGARNATSKAGLVMSALGICCVLTIWLSGSFIVSSSF